MNETNLYNSPTVAAYPKCSACDAAYVLRRFQNLTRGRGEWAWQRDCKCRKGEPVVCKESAPVPA